MVRFSLGLRGLDPRTSIITARRADAIELRHKDLIALRTEQLDRLLRHRRGNILLDLLRSLTAVTRRLALSLIFRECKSSSSRPTSRTDGLAAAAAPGTSWPLLPIRRIRHRLFFAPAMQNHRVSAPSA